MVSSEGEGQGRANTIASAESRSNATKANLVILSLGPLFLDVGFLQIVISAWLPSPAVGFTPLQVGILITAQGVLAIVSAIPLGIVSDVYGRKFILIAANVAGAFGLLTFALTTNFAVLLLVSVVLGFTEGGTVAVWNALLADLTESGNRNRVFSYSYVMMSVASGVGLLLPGFFPALEGALGISDYAIHRTVLLILGLASFASPVGVAALLWKHVETHNPSRKFAGLKNLGLIAKLGMVGGAIGFGAGFIIPLVGTWFLLRFNVGDSYSGPVLAISSILIGLASFGSPWLARKYGQLNAIMLSMGSSMVFMLAMAFLPNVNLAAAFYIIRTGLMNMANPLLDSFSMSIFPPEQRGLVSAISNTVFRLPNSVSTTIGGFLLTVGLLALPFVIASALYIVGLAAFFAFFVASSKYKSTTVPG